MPNRRPSPSLAALAMVVCALAATTRAQSNDRRIKPAGSISGTISLNDKAAPDIVVVVQPSDRPSSQLATTRTRTDANGRYRVGGLAAGQYQISAVAPALALAESTWSTNVFFGMGKVVVLTTAEDVDDIDIKLVKGAVITGRITDADEKPVVEQRVNLQLLDQSGNTTRQFETFVSYQMSMTDDRGVYRIYGLPAGRYRVSVGSSDSGYTSTNNHVVYPLTFYGASNDPNKATIVELQEGGEASNIDIRVGRAGNSFTATGRVVDDNGQPIPGVRIMWGPSRENQPFFGGSIGAPTSSRGEFRIEGLERGRYGVSISAALDNSSYYADPIFFNINDSDVTDLELRGTRGQTLSGIVLFEGSRAREVQQQLSFLRIVANVTPTSNTRAGTSSAAIVSGDGSFLIGGIRPGRVSLFVGGFSTPALSGVTVLRVERGGIDVTKGFEIQPGESISDLRVTAALGAGTIRGTVRIVGGDLPPTARLFVNARREGSTTAGNSVVDARGRFAIANLIGGTYEVVVVMSFTQPGVRPIPPQRQTINVSDEGETQVDFVIDLTVKEGGP
jgi:protocatechuate 3,4-dioxygenase beta subunit